MLGRGQGRPARAAARAVVVLTAVIVGLVPTMAAHGTTDDASRMRSKVDAVRRREGLAELTAHEIATDIAQRHSERMLRTGRLFHNERLGAEALAAGLDWAVIGENVGVGPSIDTVHYGFMDSASHRHTMLDARYRLIGIGIAYAPDRVYVTEVFVRTFAERRGEQRAKACAPHLAEDGSSVAASFYGDDC